MSLVLTNMCLIINSKGEILLQNRIKNDRPGLNLPGGHVENNETLIESVKREVKEETNLNLIKVEFVGIYEWFNKNTNRRDLAILYKSNKFNGILKSNKEGINSWYNITNLKKENLSLDLDKVLEVYGIKL